MAVAMAVLADSAAGGESAVERGGYHTPPPEHLPGTLCGVHHAAEPGVSNKPNSEKAERWGEVRALESQVEGLADLYAGDVYVDDS